MAEDNVSAVGQADDSDTETGEGRQRSAIQFPYVDFDTAAKLARAIHDNVGNSTCSLGQLAAWTDQSPKSSGFRTQVSAARMLGLLDGEGDSYRLTQLGKQLHDPITARKAKAGAFLSVPLFAAIYAEYKDGVLPPTAALERAIANFGVSLKQKERARQIFERSAEQTGFFESGKSRLVMPAIKSDDPPPPPPPPPGGGGGGGNGGGGDGLKLDHIDPLLMELLRKIPSAEEGWPEQKRLRWFRTFAMNVSQIYDDDDSAIELKIDKTV